MLSSFPGLKRFFNVSHRISWDTWYICFLLAKLPDHVVDPARGARNNLHTLFEGGDVVRSFGCGLATNAKMDPDFEVATLVTVLDEAKTKKVTNLDPP